MNNIPVFYNPKQVSKAKVFSPSAGKPVQVMSAWEGLGIPLDVRLSGAANMAQLCGAHAPSFVRDVLSCKTNNGFGTNDRETANSLPYTSGSLLHAALHAYVHGGVAVSPTSGFHHAGYNRGGGFCTFNGLMVAATRLLNLGAEKIGILDFDMHYGDGTDEIIKRLQLQDKVTHWTAGKDFHAPSQADMFLDNLAHQLTQFAGHDLVIYQAGADPHVNDPLGGWLTTQQMMDRDNIVFTTLKRMGVPVVWNLAGGYQREHDGSIPKVLEIHNNTMIACAEVYL